jgi:hypothetical protein
MRDTYLIVMNFFKYRHTLLRFSAPLRWTILCACLTENRLLKSPRVFPKCWRRPSLNLCGNSRSSHRSQGHPVEEGLMWRGTLSGKWLSAPIFWIFLVFLVVCLFYAIRMSVYTWVIALSQLYNECSGKIIGYLLCFLSDLVVRRPCRIHPCRRKIWTKPPWCWGTFLTNTQSSLSETLSIKRDFRDGCMLTLPIKLSNVIQRKIFA